jgi:hypothetical protein
LEIELSLGIKEENLPMKSNDANIDSLSWLAALLKVVCECHGRVEASSR